MLYKIKKKKEKGLKYCTKKHINFFLWIQQSNNKFKFYPSYIEAYFSTSKAFFAHFWKQYFFETLLFHIIL